MQRSLSGISEADINKIDFLDSFKLIEISEIDPLGKSWKVQDKITQEYFNLKII